MRKILEDLVEGKITIEKCENIIKSNNILELDQHIKFDTNRKQRTGFPEAILSDSKDYDDLVTIAKNYFEKINEEKISLIFTRLSKKRFEKLEKDLDYLKEDFYFEYNEKGRILRIANTPIEDNIIKEYGKVGIVTAGTSDVNVAEEAKMILNEGGCEVLTSYDIGVAGIHRLFPQIAKMIEEDVKCIIVCAGMEGALPSVVAGLVDVPIIAVPTSVGYGVGDNGKIALHAMLQSCAPGIAVVNIDNGFGAAVFALTMISSNIKKIE